MYLFPFPYHLENLADLVLVIDSNSHHWTYLMWSGLCCMQIDIICRWLEEYLSSIKWSWDKPHNRGRRESTNRKSIQCPPPTIFPSMSFSFPLLSLMRYNRCHVCLKLLNSSSSCVSSSLICIVKVQTRSYQRLQDVIAINCHIETQGDEMFWRKQLEVSLCVSFSHVIS